MTASNCSSEPILFVRLFVLVALGISACGGDIGTPNAAPVAVADLDPEMNDGAYCLGGRSSSDADGSVAAWQWDFLSGPVVPTEVLVDDGAGICLSVERVDPALAFYVYRLTVTDDRAQSASTTVRAWIPEVAAPLQGLAAEIAATATTGSPGDRVGLHADVFAGEFPCSADLCSWEQLAGPAALDTISTQCAAGTRVLAEFEAPAAQGENDLLGFRFTVRDTDEPGCESRYYVAVRLTS